MADKNKLAKAYSQPAGNSSFHQDSGEHQELQAMYSRGAFGPGSTYNQKDFAAPSGGGSGSGSGSGSSNTSGGGSTDTGAAYAAYLAELQRQRQAAAEDAYNRSMGYLNDAYDKAADNYWDVYNNGRSALEGAYDNSLRKINNNASDAMREAYINRRLSEKNLSQKLAAMGISGGASESTLAGIANNYGNARNNIQRTWDDNRGDLESGYGNNLANLYNAYLERMTALDNSRASQAAQLLSNLNNQIASVQSDFYSTLASNPDVLQNAIANALSGVNGITPKEAEVTNPYSAVSTQQGNDIGGTLTNYSMLQSLQDAGNGAYNAIQNFIQRGLTDKQIQDLMLNGYSK